MSKQYTVKLYSAQKNRETGNGNITKAIRGDDPDAEEKIKKLREDQAAENAEWKRKIRAGEPIEPKFARKVSAVAAKEHAILEKVTETGKMTPDQRDNIAEAAVTEHNLLENQLHGSRLQLTDVVRTPFALKLDARTGNTTFLLGSSKMGKSTALMRIYDKYYAEKDFVSILWTMNPQIGLYKHHRKMIISGNWNAYSEEVIKMQKKIQTMTKNKYKFLNMFDDVINVRNNTLLDNLILTYRNSKMSSIISLQYSNLMSKCSRANCNNIIAFGFNTDESIEVVIKIFLTGYLKKIGVTKLPDQINWYKNATKDHGFIYIKPAEGHVSFHRFDV